MMFRDPRPVAIWRDSLLFWCRLTEANHAAGIALWKAFIPLAGPMAGLAKSPARAEIRPGAGETPPSSTPPARPAAKPPRARKPARLTTA